MGQSSNDVFPSAVHLAALDEATNTLLPALAQLEASFRDQGEASRTSESSLCMHLMSAVPVTLGQEFAGYAAQIRLGRRRIENALPQVAQIPLGGTATGTGLNTHRDFAAKVRERMSADTGLTISAPEDPFLRTHRRGDPRTPLRPGAARLGLRRGHRGRGPAHRRNLSRSRVHNGGPAVRKRWLTPSDEGFSHIHTR